MNSPGGPSAGQFIHQRRSLLACDGRTSIAAERFYRMLARVMPRVELHVARRPMPWDAPPGCPGSLPLYLLERGDARQLATQVSCRQEIAGEGAFSLGMIAEYQASLAAHGPSFYRRLFREAGAIGRVLYLEAEAAGVRSTGIGCFFDDPVHRVIGLEGLAFQSLYHFTVGGYVDDRRLTTLPAYGRRVKARQRGMDLP